MSQKWQKALVRVRIKAAHRHWNQAGTETSPQKGPETSQHRYRHIYRPKMQRCKGRGLLDTDLGRRDLEFVLPAREQLQQRVVLVLLVYSTAHSLEMSTGQDFPAQHSLEGICFPSCSTQFPAELRSATKSSGMKQVQLERERRVL